MTPRTTSACGRGSTTRRLLKGFLQVALGAESAAAWSQLPAGMDVHQYGVLAVPRNAFLQPEALVEDLDDHRAEVRMRVAERRREAELVDLRRRGRHRRRTSRTSRRRSTRPRAPRARCSPTAATSCAARRDPTDLLVELGVPATYGRTRSAWSTDRRCRAARTLGRVDDRCQP